MSLRFYLLFFLPCVIPCLPFYLSFRSFSSLYSRFLVRETAGWCGRRAVVRTARRRQRIRRYVALPSEMMLMSDLCSVRLAVLLFAVLGVSPYCSYLLSLISYLLSLISYLLSLYSFLEGFVADLGACESDEVQVIPLRRHSNYG